MACARWKLKNPLRFSNEEISAKKINKKTCLKFECPKFNNSTSTHFFEMNSFPFDLFSIFLFTRKTDVDHMMFRHKYTNKNQSKQSVNASESFLFLVNNVYCVAICLPMMFDKTVSENSAFRCNVNRTFVFLKNRWLISENAHLLSPNTKFFLLMSFNIDCHTPNIQRKSIVYTTASPRVA